MPDWLLDIFKLLAGGLLVLIAQLLVIWRQRWNIVEARRTALANERRPRYARALELIYETGHNSDNSDRLFRIVHEWESWIPSNAAYISPAATEVLYQLMNATGIIAVNLRGGQRGREANDFFQESLHAAKVFFGNSKDIGWLPTDMKSEGRSKKSEG